MENPITLKTKRLLLNRPTESDLEDILFYLNQTSAFSENTLNMPFPYTKADAQFWFKMIEDGLKNEEAYIFGIRDKANLKLIGGIGLHLDKRHHKAELGYWIAKDFWNKGYATEAAKELIKFGFVNLKLNKIHATHYPWNPASGEIMKKCGMTQEAILKQEYFKNGEFRDMIRYSILAEQYM